MGTFTRIAEGSRHRSGLHDRHAQRSAPTRSHLQRGEHLRDRDEGQGRAAFARNLMLDERTVYCAES